MIHKAILHYAKKQRLAECEAHINQNYDVDGLRKSVPERLKSLIAAKGDMMSGQQS